MPSGDAPHVGYVLKMYPRLSETFILTEILAHEAAGLKLEIFSLRTPADGRFHEALSRVHAQVTYIPSAPPKVEEFWTTLRRASTKLPQAENILEVAQPESAGNVYQAILLAESALQRGVTHLHAHFATVATTVTRLAARLAGIPYSFTAHAKDIYHESVNEQGLRRKFRDASAVVTVSDYNLTYLRSRFGDSATRVRRIYNGLDLDEFSYSSPRDRAPLIVGVGRLVEKKGFGDLIEACAILNNRGREFRCEIIGSGVLEPELAEQITALGLADRVQLLGPQPRNVIKQRLRGAAVLAAPCLVASDGNRDGLPTVLLEAMALGTPCVSTAVTGIPELVRDGETGLIADQASPQSLADTIECLLNDQDLSLRLAANARRLIEAEFDIHRNAAAMRAIFDSIHPVKPPLPLEVG